MSVHARPCTTPDHVAAMMRVLVEGRRASPHSGYIHTGDLAWWHSYLLRRYRWDEIAYLWMTGDSRTLAWSLISPHYGAFDLFILPSEREGPHVDVMLDWTIARATDYAQQYTHATVCTMWVFEDDRVWIDHLEKRAFTRDPEYALYYMIHALDDLPAPTVPDGVVLRHTTAADCASRAEAHRAAFGSRYMTGDAYRQVMQAPGYTPDLDVIAVAPGERVAAFALGWYDAHNRVGELEPVGTHADFRGRGLAKAVVGEALRRFQARDAQHVIVYVESDNHAAQALYRAAGFQQRNTIRPYVRSIAPGA